MPTSAGPNSRVLSPSDAMFEKGRRSSRSSRYILSSMWFDRIGFLDRSRACTDRTVDLAPRDWAHARPDGRCPQRRWRHDSSLPSHPTPPKAPQATSILPPFQSSELPSCLLRVRTLWTANQGSPDQAHCQQGRRHGSQRRCTGEDGDQPYSGKRHYENDSRMPEGNASYEIYPARCIPTRTSIDLRVGLATFVVRCLCHSNNDDCPTPESTSRERRSGVAGEVPTRHSCDSPKVNA